jgi:Protein of unknown function (DUF2752)
MAGWSAAESLPGRSAAGRLTGVLRRLAIASGLSALAIGLLFVPVRICPFAVLFRIPCPGCGMGRAAHALLRGDVAQALRLHPLSVVVLPWLAWVIGAPLVRYVADGSPWEPASGTSRWFERSALALLVLLLGVWIARFLGLFGGPVTV